MSSIPTFHGDVSCAKAHTRAGWRIIVVSAALAIGAIGAPTYVRFAAPYYAAVADLIAEGRPWQVIRVGIARNDSGPGTIVRLIGAVRRRPEDPQPAAILIGKLPVAAVTEAPVVFWTLLVLWPVASYRRRVLLLTIAVPLFLGLEAATTVCQLLNPLAYASAVLAGNPSPVTMWEHWSRFLEAGGRVAVALVTAMIPITIVRSMDHRRGTVPGY